MDVKQVIVVRKDLNMRKGKMVAQGAHASIKVFLDLLRLADREGEYTLGTTPAMESWIMLSQTKVCVSVNSEEELRQVYDAAIKAGLPCSLVCDEGRTEFHGQPTYTAVAVGPAPSELVNAVTGHLPLL